jgi:predicted metal-dependent HD superfamily phosphohydrolase
MNQQSGNKKQDILAEKGEDSTLRQAFFLYKQDIELPAWVWDAIYKAANHTENEEAGTASGTRPRFLQSLRKIFLRSSE